MMHLTLVLPLLLAPVASVAHGHEPEGPHASIRTQDTQEATPAPGDAEALARAFEEQRRAYKQACSAYRKAKRIARKEDRLEEFDAAHPAGSFLGAIAPLADAGNADALLWVAEESEELALTAGEVAKLKRSAFERLVADHLAAPLMKDVVKELGRQSDWLTHAEVAGYLGKIAEGAAEERARADASYGLGLGFEELGTQQGLEQAQALYHRVVAQFPDSRSAKRAAGRLARLKLAPGNPAPEFAAVDPDGNAFKLSDYRGKVVLLDFWGFW